VREKEREMERDAPRTDLQPLFNPFHEIVPVRCETVDGEDRFRGPVCDFRFVVIEVSKGDVVECPKDRFGCGMSFREWVVVDGCIPDRGQTERMVRVSEYSWARG